MPRSSGGNQCGVWKSDWASGGRARVGTSLRAHRLVAFDTKNDVGAVLGRLDKTPQCHDPSQVRYGSEGGSTSNARRRFEGEPLASGLTHQGQRRWRRPRFNRAFNPEADVGRREIDATHGFTQCARVRSCAGVEGHGDERQLDVVVRLGNAVQAL